jgi:hypothetical protein
MDTCVLAVGVRLAGNSFTPGMEYPSGEDRGVTRPSRAAFSWQGVSELRYGDLQCGQEHI